MQFIAYVRLGYLWHSMESSCPVSPPPRAEMPIQDLLTAIANLISPKKWSAGRVVGGTKQLSERLVQLMILSGGWLVLNCVPRSFLVNEQGLFSAPVAAP